MKPRFTRLFLLSIALGGVLLTVALVLRKSAEYTFSQSLRRGNWPAVRHYLEGGADLRTRGSGGVTALMLAAEAGDLEWTQRLVQQGANVDANDEHFARPLTWAARSGNTKVVDFLLDHGAAILDDYEDTPISAAFSSGHPAIGRELKRRVKLGEELLHVMQSKPQRATLEARIQELVRQGAPTGILDGNGSPLRWAAERRDPSVLKLLLRLGARPDAEAGMGMLHPNPLLGTVAAKNLPSTLALLQHGANPNREAPGPPPLDCAVYQGNVEITRALLAAGADPNWSRLIDDGNGRSSRVSVLDDARKQGNREIIRMLAEAGAR